MQNIQDIVDVHTYIDFLLAHKKNLLICIAIKDTPGLAITEKLSQKLCTLGTVNLLNQHQHSYIFAMNKENILINQISNTVDEILDWYCKINQYLEINIISKSYKYGNEAKIYINNVNFAVNMRGLNIVVWDMQNNMLFDSVCFDTHIAPYECYRSKIGEFQATQIDQSQYVNNKYMLLTEPQIYTYLYLNRYINSNDNLLDIEAEYGTAANLLTEVTSVNKITCLNSIKQYTNLGRAYYISENLHYCTGTIQMIKDKFQGIMALNPKQNIQIDQQYIEILYNLLDLNGFLAIAIYITERYQCDVLPNCLIACGFTIEKILYQQETSPMLVEEYHPQSIQLVIAKKMPI